MKVRRLLLCLLVSAALVSTFIPSIAFGEMDDWGIADKWEEDGREYDLADQSPILLETELYALDEEGNDIEFVGEVRYQWQKSEDEGGPYEDIPEANGSSLEVTEAGYYNCIATYLGGGDTDEWIEVGDTDEVTFEVTDSSDVEKDVIDISLKPKGTYKTKIEVFGDPVFAAGDILQVIYEDQDGNQETVDYVYSCDGQSGQGQFLSKDGRSFDPEELCWELQDEEEDLEVGDTCTFELSYGYICDSIDVEVVAYLLTGISFVSKDSVQLTEGIDGIMESDESGAPSFFRYEFPGFQQGDKLTVNTDENDTVIVYIFDKSESKFINSADAEDTISIEPDQIRSDQKGEWKVGEEHEFTFMYEGFTARIPVKIVANPVKEAKAKLEAVTARNTEELTLEDEEAVRQAETAFGYLNELKQKLDEAEKEKYGLADYDLTSLGEKLNAAIAKIKKLQDQATYEKKTATAKALTVSGLKVKAQKKKKAKVTWKANTKATGYVIQYSMKKNFKKGVKTVKINKAATKKKLVKKLKAKKAYYFRIATVTKVNNPMTGKTETIQGKWSKAKKIKAKK
ncbi:MAG: fibronectin type III domain-containing protein [Firmicutes bacterium]|nr:fibronectin type III domain-containing protein [Bacillota bacterium]